MNYCSRRCPPRKCEARGGSSQVGEWRGRDWPIGYGTPYRLQCTGGFYNDQFLKLDYKNSNSEIIQCGCFIAKVYVTTNRKTLEGQFVGYAVYDIVYGTATLNKVA